MQRVVRSTLVGLLAVAGLTACGDKVTPVTITTTTTPAGNPVVHSVTVSPASVTLSVGGTAQLAASVDADAGVTDRTVTWTSSDATIASVDASGKVTAVKAGTATIIASAKAAPTVQGAAAVTVQGNGTGAVPTVTISGLNTTVCPAGGSCASVPANLQNFGTAGGNNQTGQLDVVLNVDSQGSVLKSVSSTLKCGTDSLTQTQTISGAAAPIGASASSAPVTFSFNTTAFDSTGKASLHNGTCTISASASTAAGTQSATSSQQLTLNNADVAFATVSASKGPASDASGLSWYGGDVTVKVMPVFYTSGRSAVSGVVTLGGTVPATGGAATTSTQAITTFPGTVTFAAATAPGAGGGIKGETINPVTITTTFVDNSGNAFTPAAVVNGPTRLDNQAPVAGTYAFNLQGTNNNWIGSAYTFSNKAGNGYTAAVPGAGVNNDNNGVDNVTVTYQYAPAGTTNWTTVSKATDIPASNTNTAYSLRMVETDALGNATTTAIAGTFGVDVNAPTIALSGFTNQSIVTTNTATATATVTDDFSGPNKTFVAITRQNSTVTTNAAACVVGTASTSSSHASDLGALPTYDPTGAITGYCTPVNSGTGTITFPADNAGDGYYTISSYASDQAGNLTAATTRQIASDATAPTQGGVAIPASFTGGGTASFPTSSADNMDLVRSDAILQYPAANLYYSNTLPGVAFDNVLTTSATYSFSIPNFITSLQSVNGTNNPTAPAGGNDRPTQLSVTSIDEAGNTSAAVNAAFGAATFGTATAYSSNANFTTWTVASSKATLSDCPTAGCAGGATAANPTATTLTAVATGPTGVLNIPFSTVSFYYQVAGSAWYPAGTVTAPTAQDNGVNRTWTYTFSFTPPKSTPQGASLTGGTVINVMAIGQDASGNALMSAPAAITLTNP